MGMLMAFQSLTLAFLAPVNRLVGLGGQLQEIDEKTRPDQWNDAEVQHPRHERQRAHAQTEAPVVARLEKLRQRQRARLPKTVDHESAHRDRDVHHDQDVDPPLRDEAGAGEQLERRHEHDRAGLHFAFRDRQQVTPGQPPAGHEVRHAAHVALRVDGDEGDGHHRNESEQPVDRMHGMRV